MRSPSDPVAPMTLPPHPDRQRPFRVRLCFYWLPVLALCTAIFWQSAFPSLATPSLFPHQDKLLHLAAYALLAFLTARALACERPGMPRKTIWVLAALFAAGYGLSDEIHQAFVPGRCAEIADFAADALGGMSGAWAYQNPVFMQKER
ncbi:MAG: VanZ family protein [Desulfobacter sp.]